MIDQIKIGNFLRELRKEKELTQEQVAELFGVSSRSVSRWENGNSMPELAILVELAAFYEVDIKEIIDGERRIESVEREEKETLLKVADYAEAEKKLAVRRKCIITFIGTIGLVIGIILGRSYLSDNIAHLGLGLAVVGLVCLWGTVIYKNKENVIDKKKGRC